MNSSLKTSLSTRFRNARDVKLRDALARAPRHGEALRILDLGGRTEYWKRVGYDFLTELGVSITLQNLHESEIVPDPGAPKGLFDWAIGNACDLDHADKSFDFTHSNSVIEHVGLWREMEAFASEARRVGVSYYVQTPNFWFPVEPHFWSFPMNHWLPRPMRAGLMRHMKLATAGKAKDVGEAYRFVDSARLLTKGQMRFLFPEAEISAERVALLPKSLIATYIGSTSKSPTGAKQEGLHG
ncbi:methyltransferase domain-containing protein [Paraurantiacibacter namhicola]|uniref:Methyltransferase type 11 domain-containing protein n=1 Tax=Paraurantiacibacter namhicola TaxID=645517 RepID=A0A1C7D841_9SPHN|nr:methyltransferase domain-containing protein [Paraurantiacibacter namhicola]ANU07650.1 hypothetical protein A6F65_01344 [Paraurantiacibacter namhicola]